MSKKSKTIRLRLDTGRIVELNFIETRTPGLVLILDEDERYGPHVSVTHEGSGRMMEAFDSIFLALRYAADIGDLADWTKSREEIQALDLVVKRRILECAKKSGALMCQKIGGLETRFADEMKGNER